MSRWRVAKRGGVWRIYDPRGTWHDSGDTLVEAHTYATQLAVADVLFEPGGLDCLSRLRAARLDALTLRGELERARYERDSRQWWKGVPGW